LELKALRNIYYYQDVRLNNYKNGEKIGKHGFLLTYTTGEGMGKKESQREGNKGLLSSIIIFDHEAI